MRNASTILALCVTALLFSCKKEKDTQTSQGVLTLDLPAKEVNYFGESATELNRKATLGRVLFYDKSLSLNNSIACASCHRQEFAFADNVASSRGYENRLTGRNSMAIQNLTNSFVLNSSTGLTGAFFWDGRESNLQNLVARPISNHVEMGITDLNTIPAKLAKLPYYQDLFLKAYGSKEITMDKIGESVAMFMNAILSTNTRFDQRQQGLYQFTALEAEGERLFNTKYECNNCHKLFVGGYTGSEFIDIGLEKRNNDNGAGAIIKDPTFNGKFKLPNLRNVARTAPYMHDGRFATLEDVLEHYSHGIQDDPNLDFRLKEQNGKPIRMNISADEKKALVAFLNTMTDYTMLTSEKYSSPFKIK